MRIDNTDREIIRELQEDGRRSLRDIGRSLDIPEATIRLRVKRLSESGVLQIVAFADPTKLGQSQLALAFVTTEAAAHDAVVAQLLGWPEISYLSSTLGAADICAQCVCQDQAALWALRQRIAGLEGVITVQVTPETQVHKLRFTMPTEVSEDSVD